MSPFCALCEGFIRGARREQYRYYCKRRAVTWQSVTRAWIHGHFESGQKPTRLPSLRIASLFKKMPEVASTTLKKGQGLLSAFFTLFPESNVVYCLFDVSSG